MRQNYYNLAEQALEYRLRSMVDMLPSTSLSKRDRYNAVVRLVEDFSEKDKFELMILNEEGDVLVTSSGFSYSDDSLRSEFTQAQLSDSSSHVFIGRAANNEKVIAITQFLSADYGDAKGIRFVSSLRGVDQYLSEIIQLMGLVGLLMMIIVSITGNAFVRSIVSPLHQIGKTAEEIAAGELTVRINKPYFGEIGDLVDSINDMASELETSSRMKNDFISSISHEIRTPLTSIKGWGETLTQTDTIDPPLLNQGLEIIVNETDRLSNLVEDLLDFSRLEGKGTFSFSPQPLDLVAELTDSVIIMTQRANKLSVNVQYDEPDESIIVSADSNRLKQVFSNIFDNALKYSPTDGTIFVSLETANNQAIITIRDQGLGIPEDEIEKVTERYYRASNSSYGTGIGLALVQEIMTLHRGHLSIQSKLGEGTSVTVSFPLYKENE